MVERIRFTEKKKIKRERIRSSDKSDTKEKKKFVPSNPDGRPTKYKPEYAQIARTMCSMGATCNELAEAFDVDTSTIWYWSTRFPEFSSALKVRKGEYDEEVVRSLAMRAKGYTYDAVKIINDKGRIIRVKYKEHVPPDPGAAKIWLCNRRPDEWREKKDVDLSGTVEVKFVE